jgi:hypothetical protein
MVKKASSFCWYTASSATQHTKHITYRNHHIPVTATGFTGRIIGLQHVFWHVKPDDSQKREVDELGFNITPVHIEFTKGGFYGTILRFP